MSPTLESLALYARCIRKTDDFSIEVETYGLRWRVGHRPSSPIRSRGTTVTSDAHSLLRAMRDAWSFVRTLPRIVTIGPRS